MKNNFYNIPEDWYKEFNNTFNMTNMSMNNPIDNTSMNLATPKEGFLKGNLFNNLYDPYKNYTYGLIKASTDKEELLYSILIYKFALNDLDLYLDTHPNNQRMIDLYNQYLSEEMKLTNEFEKKYEPLTLNSDYLKSNSWKWIKSPWPWEGTK